MLQKLRSLAPTRSLCLVLNTKDAGIAGLLIEGQLEQAEAALQGKLLEGENIADKLRSLVTNLMLQKRFLEARESVMALLQLRPDEEQAWAMLGIIEMEREQYHAAIDALEQARSINPTKWVIPLFLAQCYEKLGEADKAASYASLAYNLGAVSFQI